MDERDDWSLVCSLAGVSTWEMEALSKAGWNVTRLATLQSCETSILDAVIWRIQEKEDSFSLSREVLDDLVKRAASRAKTRHLVDAKRGAQELLDAHVAHQREMRSQGADGGHCEALQVLSLKLHIASSDLAMRELAEKQERDRWVKEIQEIIKSAGLPEGHDLYTQEEIDEQLMRLMTFMPGEGQAKQCRRPRWTTTGPVALVEELQRFCKGVAEASNTLEEESSGEVSSSEMTDTEEEERSSREEFEDQESCPHRMKRGEGRGREDALAGGASRRALPCRYWTSS